MVSKKGLGIVVLSALAAACTPSSNTSLDNRVNGAQEPEITQASISRQDKLNEARLRELKVLYPSPNLWPVYVGDFNAFIEDRVSGIEAMVKGALADPGYWTNLAGSLNKGELSGFYPLRSRGITTSQKLQETLSDPDSKKELGEAIVGHYAGMTILNLSRYYDTSLSNSFFHIFEENDFDLIGNSRAYFVFNFGREAFEKRGMFVGKDVLTISPETNSLLSYMVAKIYAEQMANGAMAGERVSAQDMLSLNDELRIEISRASALMETYNHFRQIDGQSPETRFVGNVLRENIRLAEFKWKYPRTITPSGMTLIERLRSNYQALMPNVAAASSR